MKKVIITGVFAFLGVIALSSCNKEYSCTCSIQGDIVAKGKNATDACTDAEESVLGISVETCIPA
ncbi:MAG: hypothetical protein QNK23_08805 [Crocinitomicaceae bacterium]|nr:hypothetical protein [Crocinitomicaceae bacterium]